MCESYYGNLMTNIWNLRFTLEVEQINSLSPRDVLLQRRIDGFLESGIYHKRELTHF